MASAEYQGCPPRVVRGSAAQASIASSVNQIVRLPRCRKLASYAGQFVTLCACLGMRWRRAWFSLKGKAGIRGQRGSTPLRHPAPSRQKTDPCTTLAGDGSRPSCSSAIARSRPWLLRWPRWTAGRLHPEGGVFKGLCGHAFSASAVDKRLDEGLAAFARRRLEEPFAYL